MKKVIFWISIPLLFTVMLIFRIMGMACMKVFNAADALAQKLEGGCYPNGIGYNPQKEAEERAKMRRNIHKNGNPP
ncbi:hypothetical protein [Acinetobacter sp.]|uniref:hypothetical protein n=1 Tax=Acinetobacter sp. TaxID=472 RepID=UPI003890C059